MCAFHCLLVGLLLVFVTYTRGRGACVRLLCGNGRMSRVDSVAFVVAGLAQSHGDRRTIDILGSMATLRNFYFRFK